MPKEKKTNNAELTDEIKQQNSQEGQSKQGADDNAKQTKSKNDSQDLASAKAPKEESSQIDAEANENNASDDAKPTKSKKVKVSTDDLIMESKSNSLPTFKTARRMSPILILVIAVLLIGITASVMVVTLGNRGTRVSEVDVEITPILVTDNITMDNITDPTNITFTNETGTTSKLGTPIDLEIQNNQYVMYQYKITNKCDYNITYELEIPDLNNTNFDVTYNITTQGTQELPFQSDISGTLERQQHTTINVFIRINNSQVDATIQGNLTLTITMV